MNVYVFYNKFGTLQFVYGDYFMARRFATSDIRLLGNNRPQDLISGRVLFSSLDIFNYE